MTQPAMTDKVLPHEKAWVLREFEEYDYRLKSMRRVQDIYLVRDGEMRVSRADLGPAIAFPGAPEIRVVGLGESCVQELVEQAQGMRAENRASEILANRGPSDLIERYKAYKNEAWELMHNRSVFGPGFKKERNLFAHKRRKYARPEV